jgi:hypothetical protein
MSQAPKNQVDQIREDLACPDCQYNLRGLSGTFVSCPECGMTVDVAQLVTQQWTRPWHKAPGYNRLAYPIVIAAMGLPFAMVIGINMKSEYGAGVLVTIVLLIALLVTIWIARKDGYEAWVHCVFLIPPVIGGYLTCVFVIIGAVVNLVSAIESGDLAGFFLSVMMVLGAIGAFWGCRKLDRYIAGRCIARYLAHSSAD